MASKRSPTDKTAEPPRIDDLKLINGIGPAVEKRLNGVGIFTFAQLAALSPADVAAAVASLAGLSAERIVKQDWIGQARKLAAESIVSEAQEEVETPAAAIEDALVAIPPAEPQKDTETIASKERLHPATFTVELLLDEHNKVYSTHVLHVQSRREHSWTGWPKSELVDFLVQSAGVNVMSVEPVPVTAEELEPAPEVVEEPEHLPEVVVEGTPLTAKPALAGTLHLRDINVLTAGSSEPRRLLPHDEPFDVRLTLDLSEITVPGNTPLNYTASIYRKSRSDPSGQIIGETEGTINPADNVTIDVEGNLLPGGSYRLAATVILALPGTKPGSKPDIMAVIEGGRIRVY